MKKKVLTYLVNDRRADSQSSTVYYKYYTVVFLCWSAVLHNHSKKTNSVELCEIFYYYDLITADKQNKKSPTNWK